MLYKQLNEKRTQGEWVAESHEERESKWWGNIIAHLDKSERGYQLIEIISCQIKRNGIERAQANAQYTCLAVNNLHHLAEALEDDKNAFTSLHESILRVYGWVDAHNAALGSELRTIMAELLNRKDKTTEALARIS